MNYYQLCFLVHYFQQFFLHRCFFKIFFQVKMFDFVRFVWAKITLMYVIITKDFIKLIHIFNAQENQCVFKINFVFFFQLEFVQTKCLFVLYDLFQTIFDYMFYSHNLQFIIKYSKNLIRKIIVCFIFELQYCGN